MPIFCQPQKHSILLSATQTRDPRNGCVWCQLGVSRASHFAWFETLYPYLIRITYINQRDNATQRIMQGMLESFFNSKGDLSIAKRSLQRHAERLLAGSFALQDFIFHPDLLPPADYLGNGPFATLSGRPFRHPVAPPGAPSDPHWVPRGSPWVSIGSLGPRRLPVGPPRVPMGMSWVAWGLRGVSMWYQRSSGFHVYVVSL